MLNERAIADQYAWLYTKLKVPAGTWDHVIPNDGCYVCIKKVNGIDYVMFRGSITFMDWIEDISAAALPFPDDKLGWVHNGFRSGLFENIGYVNSLVGSRVVVVGHSLGAGHALLYAGYRILDKLPVEEVFVFGEPRSGGPRLAAVLSHTPVTSFRNTDKSGHDLVTDVPVSLEVPFLGGIQYVHPKPLTDVSQSPDSDNWGPFKYHHFSLYCRALGAKGSAALSLPA